MQPMRRVTLRSFASLRMTSGCTGESYQFSVLCRAFQPILGDGLPGFDEN
jgi:hypothetical protein